MEDKEKNAENFLEEVEKENSLKKEKENKQLRTILLSLGIFVILIILGGVFFGTQKDIAYKGVVFEPFQEGGKTFYNTKIPTYKNGVHVTNYNFYLRTHPDKLKKIEFDGNFDVKNLIVLHSEEDFICEGYGAVSVANMKQLFETAGGKVLKDDEAGCENDGKYTYINFKPGEKTKIEQIGKSCYNIIIKDCEIIEGTERFMIETFADLKLKLDF